MSTTILSKLFWLFPFLFFLLLFQLNDESIAEKDNFPEHPSVENQEKIKSYPLFFAAYKKINIELDDTARLSAIVNAIKAAEKEGFTEVNILQQLNIVAANIHWSRWHYKYALDSYKAAQSQVYDQQIEEKIKKLRTHLTQQELERNLNDDYIATKNTGPAKSFKGTILVAYIFVDQGLNTRWSNKTKLRTQQTMALVQQWFGEKATEYNVNDIAFTNKTFIARKNPNLKNNKNISFTSSNSNIEDFVKSIMQTLGENSVGDFIEEQMKLESASQGVVIFHTNLNQRSFARRCAYTHERRDYINGKYETKMISKCRDEYVMLMEEVKRNRWDKIHYAQAHEIMHLFGAADLYNIKNASDYAVTDIMNFSSKSLIDSKVDPITAFAIGWQNKPPKAPFRILER
jgi:phosphohistidine phosphatase SixA